jgi:hypothetical protein
MLNKSTPDQMSTLSSCMNKARENGYDVEFEFRERGLCVPGQDKCFSPQQIHVENYYRFEGVSDPADNVILYLIRTDDGTKGFISDAYGTYADQKLGDFMQEVEEISKKVNQNKS